MGEQTCFYFVALLLSNFTKWNEFTRKLEEHFELNVVNKYSISTDVRKLITVYLKLLMTGKIMSEKMGFFLDVFRISAHTSSLNVFRHDYF